MRFLIQFYKTMSILLNQICLRKKKKNANFRTRFDSRSKTHIWNRNGISNRYRNTIYLFGANLESMLSGKILGNFYAGGATYPSFPNVRNFASVYRIWRYDFSAYFFRLRFFCAFLFLSRGCDVKSSFASSRANIRGGDSASAGMCIGSNLAGGAISLRLLADHGWWKEGGWERETEKTGFKSRPDAYTIMRIRSGLGTVLSAHRVYVAVHDGGLLPTESLRVPSRPSACSISILNRTTQLRSSAIFGVCISVWPLAKEKKIRRVGLFKKYVSYGYARNIGAQIAGGYSSKNTHGRRKFDGHSRIRYAEAASLRQAICCHSLMSSPYKSRSGTRSIYEIFVLKFRSTI